jgi:hypothetical protein
MAQVRKKPYEVIKEKFIVKMISMTLCEKLNKENF